MNKTTISAIIALGLAHTASASVSLTFSEPSAGSYLTNLSDNGETGGTTGLFWGIVVDSAGDGFDSGAWLGGFTLDQTQNGIILSTSAGVSDDILHVADSLTTNSTGVDPEPVGGGPGSEGTILDMSGVILSAAENGDNFALIWFDSETNTVGTVSIGAHYGILEHGALPGLAFTVNEGNTDFFDDNFAGADPSRQASLQFAAVPEPSSIALLALGSVALLLRRSR